MSHISIVLFLHLVSTFITTDYNPKCKKNDIVDFIQQLKYCSTFKTQSTVRQQFTYKVNNSLYDAVANNIEKTALVWCWENIKQTQNITTIILDISFVQEYIEKCRIIVNY